MTRLLVQGFERFTLKARFYFIIIFLGAIPVVGALATLTAVRQAAVDNAALDRASQGTIYLEQINGQVYNVVMESRGIYMSADWKAAEPFARRLLGGLAEMQATVERWQLGPIEEQRAAIDELSRRIKQFVAFRTELVRLAREEATAAARAYGDNELNRKARSALNDSLTAVARAYERAIAQNRAKVEANNTFTLRLLLALASIAVAASACGLVLVSVVLLRPLLAIKTTMGELAQGRLDCQIAGLGRSDEIGEMARMVDVFKTNSVERDRLERERSSVLQQEIERQRQLGILIDRFRDGMTRITETLTHERGVMGEAATSLTMAATTAMDLAGVATRASSGAAEGTQAAAAATEQLGASINEISVQAQRASTIVDETTRATKAAHGEIAALSDASSRIAAATQLITDIAEQTNLLALNATIEAARAGEAGRGFSVVATEVKALASRTTKASAEIAELVRNIQGSTVATVSSITAINARIEEIAAMNGAVAAAVEEQGAATSEIARSVSQAAASTHDAMLSATQVNEAAGQTQQDASRVEATSHGLSRVTQTLMETVEQFLGSIGNDLDERRKSVRFAVKESIALLVEGKRITATAVDASLGGIGLRPDPGLAVGQAVTVELPAGPVQGTVMWADGQRAGLGFRTMLAHLPFVRPSQMKEAA